MNRGFLDRFLIGVLKRFFNLRGAFRSATGQRALIPHASASGGSLAAVIAIMAFLASLTSSVALRVSTASEGWQSSVSHEITIQIRPILGTPIDPEIKKAAAIIGETSGLKNTYVYSKAESEKLLEPWLGNGLDFDQLPVPRMITAQIDENSPPDLDALRLALGKNVKGASLDDHRAWSERLSIVGRTLVLATLTTLGLVIAAAGFAIAFATRGAMISNREIIEVLHFVGASESYIARQFQIHFLWIGIKGGMIGAGAAIILFLMLHIAARQWSSSPNGAEIIALFGTFSVGLNAIIAVLLIVLLMALVAALVSRATANRTIRGLN